MHPHHFSASEVETMINLTKWQSVELAIDESSIYVPYMFRYAIRTISGSSAY